ncbi:hypothetical protein C0Q70_04630 [Pomacea canaliculata]|uniref:Secreted protein n=1 Tax=Pomacea canaliculata TaxID=400727 RepID=A0A2T7PIW8_POMCA|nr:hypothetical protein C0Q70_04630 [Pomacea canaliculata]
MRKCLNSKVLLSSVIQSCSATDTLCPGNQNSIKCSPYSQQDVANNSAESINGYRKRRQCSGDILFHSRITPRSTLAHRDISTVILFLRSRRRKTRKRTQAKQRLLVQVRN